MIVTSHPLPPPPQQMITILDTLDFALRLTLKKLTLAVVEEEDCWRKIVRSEAEDAERSRGHVFSEALDAPVVKFCEFDRRENEAANLLVVNMVLIDAA
eukprot:scaffold41309_cov387-Skeletonema_marinoi.AAC.1